MTLYRATAEGPVPMTPEEEAEFEASRQPGPPTREDLKAARTEAVARIQVTTSSGKTFDGDEDSQTRMARAILIGQATGLTTTQWTLADNSVAMVTGAELTEALALAGQLQAELWPIPA